MEEAASLPWNKLPAPVLSLVKSSCRDLLTDNADVTIDEAALERYVEALDHRALLAQPKKMFPLNFPTPRSEINFLCTLASLQIGSGWRVALHAQRGGKGAAETITFGCMGMHISGEITAQTLLNLSQFEVSQLFGLKITEEFELQPGIHSERPTELKSLAEAIRRVCNTTGTMLRSLGFEDWAAFWMKGAKIQEIDPATNEPVRPSAEEAVARLVRSFEALQDAYILPPRAAAAAAAKKSEEAGEAKEASADAAAAASAEAPAPAAAPASSSSSSSAASSAPRAVYLLKKAQLMVADLYLRFHDDASLPFNYRDIDSLAVFSDNVLPAVLRAQGVLVYSPELAKAVDSGVKITDRTQEASIRAGAVVACEKIIGRYNALKGTPDHPRPLNAVRLDYDLWLAGKKPEFRKLARHATHSIYY